MIRALFERAISLSLPPKKMKVRIPLLLLFKKLHLWHILAVGLCSFLVNHYMPLQFAVFVQKISRLRKVPW